MKQRKQQSYNPPHITKARFNKAVGAFGNGCKEFFKDYLQSFQEFAKNTEIGFANLGTSDDSQPQAFLDVQKDGSEVLSSKMTIGEFVKEDDTIATTLDFDPEARNQKRSTFLRNVIVFGRKFHNGDNSAYRNALAIVKNKASALLLSQDNILRHEFLHVFTHFSDDQLANALGLLNINGEPSAAIQNFIDKDCNPALTSLKAANFKK